MNTTPRTAAQPVDTANAAPAQRFGPGTTAREARPETRLHAVAAGESEPWEEPAPLSGAYQLPPFPVDALPGWLADQVAAVAEFTQTPPDLAGCVALAVVSTAAGGRAVVEVRGSWREPVNVFTVVVLPPGSRKSAVFAAMTRPLLDVERQLAEEARPHVVEAGLARAIAQRAAEKAANAASATVDALKQGTALATAADAAMTADAIEVPAVPRLVADDITAEKAATLLAEQQGRLAVLSPEGGIFATLAGRYSGMPNLEVFLKGHAGDMLRVDRIGRPAEHIDHPALTLGLAVQPEVLADLTSMPGFRGRGLLARILYALPESTVGRRRPGAPAIPPAVEQRYCANLTTLVRALARQKDPLVLPLTTNANTAVLELEKTIEPKLAPGAEWAHIIDWASKYAGASVRLAGLVHLAEHLHHGRHDPIDHTTIERGIRLGRYFAAHALAAFDSMGADPTIEAARYLLAHITRRHPNRFTKRNLFSTLPRGRFRKVNDLEPGLELLEQHGHIRREHTTQTTPRTGRPPSTTFHLHPQHHNQPCADRNLPTHEINTGQQITTGGIDDC